MATREPAVRIDVDADGDQVFQKYIVHRSSLGKELEVAEVTQVHIGFVTGLDTRWLTLVRSDTGLVTAVRLSNVTSVQETGKTLDDLPDEVREQVVFATRLFTRIVNRQIDKLRG